MEVTYFVNALYGVMCVLLICQIVCASVDGASSSDGF